MQTTVNYQGGMKFTALAGPHNIAIDLPVSSGGTGTAATPTQLFLASLASCVGVYVVTYCNNVGLNTKGMQVGITAEKVPDPNRLDNIKIKVSLPHADVGKRQEAVLAVARKCLIHNTIKNHPNMNIELSSATT